MKLRLRGELIAEADEELLIVGRDAGTAATAALSVEQGIATAAITAALDRQADSSASDMQTAQAASSATSLSTDNGYDEPAVRGTGDGDIR